VFDNEKRLGVLYNMITNSNLDIINVISKYIFFIENCLAVIGCQKLCLLKKLVLMGL